MYHDKELFIFDLDDTLILHNVDLDLRKQYEDKLIPFLNNLKYNGKILTLVTYNTNPTVFLNKYDILHLFDYIYSPQLLTFEEYAMSSDIHHNSTIWISGKIVRVCVCKSVIVKQILEKFNCTNDKTIFFDDHSLNIKKVEQLGIQSILVDPLKGIPI